MQNPFALDDLCLVRTIGEAGTLTGAARRLRVDHSTAFRRLGAIEERFGVRLFERARDGYTPTRAGEAAIETAVRILDDIGDLERRLAGADLRPSGIVRLTTTDTLLELIGPVLADLRLKHPGITIELVADNSFVKLTKRDADIALRAAATMPEHLVGRRLAMLPTAPYAAPAYLARHSDRTKLSAYEWIGFEESLRHLSSAKWMDANVASDCIVCRTNSLLASRAAARAGMGVAALPCYLGDPDTALRRVHLPLEDMEVSLWLLTHPDLRRVTRIRAVLDFVAVRLVEQRPLIEGATLIVCASPDRWNLHFIVDHARLLGSNAEWDVSPPCEVGRRWRSSASFWSRRHSWANDRIVSRRVGLAQLCRTDNLPIGGNVSHPCITQAGRLACVTMGLLVCGTHWINALAAGSCSGNIQTSLIHPLPAPMTVSMQNSVDNSPNPVLARRFVAGLQRAGVTLVDQGNVMLSITVTVVPSASARNSVGGVYKGFDWVSGEQTPNVGQGPGLMSANLSMSATLTDTAQSTLSWVATLQCIVKTDSSGNVAEDLGEVIGRSLGQNVERKAI